MKKWYQVQKYKQEKRQQIRASSQQIYKVQAALTIRGFAIHGFDHSHWNLLEPNPLHMQ